MSGSRIQLPHAADFLVHSFECGSEHLFALQGMLSCAGKASASRCPFSARGPTILARQRAFPIAHIAKTLAQRLKVIKSGIIDFGMVTAQDEFMFVVAENAAFEFAGYGHGRPQLYAVAASSRAAARFFVYDQRGVQFDVLTDSSRQTPALIWHLSKACSRWRPISSRTNSGIYAIRLPRRVGASRRDENNGRAF